MSYSSTLVQMSLYDVPIEELKEQAITAAENGANTAWLNRARLVLRAICESQEYLTADDLTKAMWSYPESTSDLRAVGAVFRRAAKEGLIKSTDQFVPSSNPHSHGCPRRVWRSLTWQQMACSL